jgi:glutaredoxin-like YruB-family protein
MTKVEIYTSNTCKYCNMAKDFFTQNNIDYIEYNISKNSQAMKKLMKMGYTSIPLIIVGDEIITGFDKEKIEKLINN